MSCEISKMSDDPFRKLSILYADWEHLNARLRDYYNNLHKLEKQIAEHGTIDIPLNLLNARDSTESEIAKLATYLPYGVASFCRICLLRPDAIVSNEAQARSFRSRWST